MIIPMKYTIRMEFWEVQSIIEETRTQGRLIGGVTYGE